MRRHQFIYKTITQYSSYRAVFVNTLKKMKSAVWKENHIVFI